SLCVFAHPQSCDGDPAAYGRLHELRIGLQIINNLAARRKPVRLFAWERKIRQFHRPVWKLEPEAIPPLAPPSLPDPAALGHEMRAAAPGQHVAHGESSLAAADDQRLHMLLTHGARPLSIGSIQRRILLRPW